MGTPHDMEPMRGDGLQHRKTSGRWLVVVLSVVAAAMLLCALAAQEEESWTPITSLKAVKAVSWPWQKKSATGVAVQSMLSGNATTAAPAVSSATSATTPSTDPPVGFVKPMWSYGINDPKGPLQWPKLWNSTLKNGFCDGKEQSPIDIKTGYAEVGASDMLHLNNWKNNTNFTIFNNGRFLQIMGFALNKDFTLYKGNRWDLQRIIVHSPSEHRIDGVQYPMELQFMHSRQVDVPSKTQGISNQTKKTEYMAISVLYAMGASNVAEEKTKKYTTKEEIEPNPVLLHELLWSSLSKLEAGESKVLTSLQGPDGFLEARDLLPKSLDYYQYEGSLTYPPCTQGFEWLVVKANMFVTFEQMEHFPKADEGSYRPPQALTDRMVKWLSGKKEAPAAPSVNPNAFTLDCGLYGDNCGSAYYVGPDLTEGKGGGVVGGA